MSLVLPKHKLLDDMARISSEKGKSIVQNWCSVKGISLIQLAKIHEVSVNGVKK